MKKLYFIRHGLSEMNVQAKLAGHTETPLTNAGKTQAKKAGQSAKHIAIDLIISSPLSRALETATIFAKQINYPSKNIIVNPILIERFYGVMEGHSYSPDLNFDGVSDFETDNILVTRARLALDWINSLKADNILVVSHGSFGRALRSITKSEYPMSHPERINNAELLCWVEE